jgi:hypothetical protein
MIQTLKNFFEWVFKVGTAFGALGGFATAVWLIYLTHNATAEQLFNPGIISFLYSNGWMQVALLIASPFLGCIAVGMALGLLIYVFIMRLLDAFGDTIHGR